MLPSSRTVSFQRPMTASLGMALTALISLVVRGPAVVPSMSALVAAPPVISFWPDVCR